MMAMTMSPLSFSFTATRAFGTKLACFLDELEKVPVDDLLAEAQFRNHGSALLVHIAWHCVVRRRERIVRGRQGEVDFNLLAGVGVVNLELSKTAGSRELEDGNVQFPDVPVHGLAGYGLRVQ
jgi:hypothetical protein